MRSTLVKPRTNVDRLLKAFLESGGAPSYLNRTQDPDDMRHKIPRHKFIPVNSNPGDPDALVFGSGEKAPTWDGSKHW